MSVYQMFLLEASFIVSILYFIANIFEWLKPQDSFGKKDFKNSWSAESAAHRQKTLIYLPALVWNDVFSCNVKWLNIIAMYITYGRVFGGDSEHFDIWVISWKW